MARLLLVDDDPAMLFALKELAESRGHEAVLARSGADALALVEGVDAIVTDYAMPAMDGVQLLKSIRDRDESLPVILLTAHGSERIAVRAMKAGAYEYVTKPFDIEEMGLVLERALEARGLRVQNRRLSAEKALGKSIIADSAPMRRLIDAVSRVAPRDITVLIGGPTGTGK
jgi:two-component system response regulator AtoC